MKNYNFEIISDAGYVTGKGLILDRGVPVASVSFAYDPFTKEIEIGDGMVFVRQNFRKKGLAKKVCEETLRRAMESLSERGIRPTKATMQAAEWNSSAIALAISMGYKKVENFYSDSVHFEKSLC